MHRLLVTAILTAETFLFAGPAFAHTGPGAVHGFGSGVLHPFTGFDHQLTMVAVGLWAAQRGGKFLWALPLAFVAVMALGAGVAVTGVQVPLVEQGILLSIVALGAAIGLRAKLPLVASVAAAGLFALCHGYAHGTEMPTDATSLQYFLGFASATVLLQGAGMGAGVLLNRSKGERWLGWGIASAGVTLAIGG